jgi:predicted N-acyltransferase
MDKLEVEFVNSIASIGKQAWNGITEVENPFARYEFLWGLEDTGCTTEEKGWAPYHVALYQKGSPDRELVGVMPLYLKTNSYGEYVFDWSWAGAYKNHGLNYYPKFVTAIPFTPSQGSRVFLKDSTLMGAAIEVISRSIKKEATALNASSWHVLFPTKNEHHLFQINGIQERTACQFHWYNKEYGSFDDFLQGLNSRKRKNIKKERQAVAKQNIRFEIVDGGNVLPDQWERFYAFYQSTYQVRGMSGYLSLEFFKLLSHTMPEQLFLVQAIQDEQCIAAALFFRNSQQLFGRYWGSAKDFQFLHFETCFYQGQEYCIKNGLLSFDSGAQGEHKIQRGFEPVKTYSNHWLADQRFSNAISDFLEEERQHIDHYMEQAKSLLPFKQI